MKRGIGAGSRIRTRDPLITNQVLYQLSYTGAVTDLLEVICGYVNRTLGVFQLMPLVCPL